VAADDLSAPLGQHRTRTRPALGKVASAAFAGALGLMVAAFIGWVLVVEDPLGGEPTAVVAIAKMPKKAADVAPPPAPESSADPARRLERPADPAAKPDSPASQTVTIIDGSSGRRQQVTVAAAPPDIPVAGEARMLEQTRHGFIPKVGLDGARALSVYAQPVAGAARDLPRVAIVVTGMGIGARVTGEALAKLPAPITLAFSPYGADLGASIGRARSDGHEVLLQVPMEPFDYPDNDPGPHGLLTSLAPEQNIDRLHWLMSRFQGYVGLANAMGARFTASEAALTPVLKEAARRGLMFFDDASSPRSLAGQVAGARTVPFVKADVVLDAVPTVDDIGKALARLETRARANGLAVGVAGALPVAIERIAQWAKTAEARGFLLVPVTAAAARAKSS